MRSGSVYLVVRNFEKSLDFYEKVLDMQVSATNGNRFAMFNNDGLNLCLMNGYYDVQHPDRVITRGGHFPEYDDQHLIAAAENPGKVFINLGVPDLREEYARIQRLGIADNLTPIRYIEVFSPYWYFTFQDPDGNPIEITGGYEETPDFEIKDYFQCRDQAHWAKKIAAGDWRAAKYLAELLENGKFQELTGGGTVYLLVDGDKLVSFVTLTRQDCVADETLYPWLGFFYTFPEYRGQRLGGKLLEYAVGEAKKQGYEQVYLATDHVGLYEKYGFTYWENRVDIYGEDSRIYIRRTV